MSTSVIKTEPGTSKETGPRSKRVHLSRDWNAISKEQLVEFWKSQDMYIDHLENVVKIMEEKLKRSDVSRREHLLVVRLAAKDQEMQELLNQVAELKAAQLPSLYTLKNSLIDPAINLIIIKLKKELELMKTKLQESQDELKAWKFTPDSITGKRLMLKCRQLLQENEEIGKMISSERLAILEGETAMQKNLCDEMKKNQSEMDDFVQELDEDVEGMQSTIYLLQQQLKEAKETISNLSQKNKAVIQTVEVKVAEPETKITDLQEKPVEKISPPVKPVEKKSHPVKPVEQKSVTEKPVEKRSLPEKPVEKKSHPEEIKHLPEKTEEKKDNLQMEVEHAQEGSKPHESEEEVLTTRSTRRGRTTPTKSTRGSPSKRGRAARGQKREVRDSRDNSVESVSPGRPKRKRGAPQRSLKEEEEEKDIPASPHQV